MKNVKLGVKLVGGFAIVAVIVFIVGAFGWRGARNLTEQISQVGRVRLPSVAALLEIEKHYESFRVAQRTLLVPGMSWEENQRQVGILNRLRLDVAKVREEYESLPATAEETAAWRQTIAAIDRWREVNDRFIQMARELHQTGISNPANLRANLQQFRGDHHALMGQVYALITRGVQFEGGENPEACNFGHWLAEFRTDNPLLLDILRRMPASHNPFHQSIGRIKEQVRLGNIDAANRILAQETLPLAGETFARFDEMIEVAQAAETIFENMTQT